MTSSIRNKILSNWDHVDSEKALAPISSLQKELINKLRSSSSSSSSSSNSGGAGGKHVNGGLTNNNNTEDPTTNGDDGSSSCGGTTTTITTTTYTNEGKEGGGKSIETGQQFLKWLHETEINLNFVADEPYRNYIKQLENVHFKSRTLLDHIQKSLNYLESLREEYQFVSGKSNALHDSCQHLLEQQTQLSQLSQQVKQKLIHYTQAHEMEQKLTSATFTVHSEGFIPLLQKIDESMSFISQHPNYKQSSIYRVKYQACLSRALGMIKSYLRNNLDKASPSTTSRTADSTSSPDVITLFYGKFRAIAPKISPILNQVEVRSSQGFRASENGSPSPLWGSYEALLNDCHGIYFEKRNYLILPSVKSTIIELTNKHKNDHCGLLRGGCAFLIHICEDEYQLYHQFFSSSTSQLNDYLEGVCQVLYDALRPLIIHLHHLETLSELTGILRSEMLGHHCLNHPAQLESFEKVMSSLMQDIQERLVYRAHIYIRTDIGGYTPAQGDLAYPEKLEMMESIAQSLSSPPPSGDQRMRKNSTASITSATSLEVAQINTNSSSSSPADMHGMWYPPLRRTLLCLSKLYRCLDRGIFQGLSQEALTACIHSISEAANQISMSPKKSPIDGQLFEIKHLLILREQIAPFQVDLSVKEMSLDFSKLKMAAYSMLTTKKNLLELSSNNVILEFLLEGSLPEVKEHSIDSRKEVDRRLKAVCEAFILHVTILLIGPIKSFISRCEQLRQSTNGSEKISSQPWGKSKDVQETIAVCQRQLKKILPSIQRSMQLYISNKETEFILFRPIRNNVISSFISIQNIIRSDYNSDDILIIGCPSQEQVTVLISSLQLQPKNTLTTPVEENQSQS